MKPTEHRVFRARLAELRDVTTFVERFCRDRGIPAPDRLRVALVVEELFTNTVTHGHGGGADAPVDITLSTDAGAVVLRYEDIAPPFDPLAARDGAAASQGNDVGGWGLLLVRQLARDMRYAHEGGRNRLWLHIGDCPTG